jgi:anti-sigma B factor antagonist
MDAAQGLTISTARSVDEVVITARGEIDFANVSILVGGIEAEIDDSVTLCIIDFEKVTFIDSETVKALLALRRRYAGLRKEIKVRRCSRPVARLLSLLGVQRQIGLLDDCDDTIPHI